LAVHVEYSVDFPTLSWFTLSEQKVNRRCHMSKHSANKNGLVQKWVPVKDQSGRTHMEARWVAVTAAETAPTPNRHHAG
jgi:hypothetical protein